MKLGKGVCQHCASVVCAWFEAQEFDFFFSEGEMS